ncbi:MAG: cellulase family glycosylhydrolase, partial [Planctomycetales bacterium]|nr:cellulase family glycosylhydrolase [Planctomycetales bacterium]
MFRILSTKCIALYWAGAAGWTLTWGANFALAANVARPAHNLGVGFFVENGEIYDANGNPFRIRGVNHTHAFGVQATNTAAIPEIAKSNANAVRLVFFKNGTGITLTAREQRQRIVDYVAHQIVPIVELHDYTGGNNDVDGSSIEAAVDYWLEPSRKAYLKEYEREVILNIANEWGPNSAVWRDAYVSAVERLRVAGVNNLIMIDAGGNFGQNPNSIKTYGSDVFHADPQQNVVFSQHMYGYWRSDPDYRTSGGWKPPFLIADELAALKATGLPLVVGEFGWEDFSEVNYDTSDAIQAFEEAGVGWLAWAWYRGASGDSLSLVKNVNGAPSIYYNSDDDLTAYGNLVVNDPAWGLKVAAEKASIFFKQGDFNRDGVVDESDLTSWESQFTPADRNGTDFLNWQRGFEGNAPQDLVGTPIPEATSSALVGTLAMLWAAARRRGSHGRRRREARHVVSTSHFALRLAVVATVFGTGANPSRAEPPRVNDPRLQLELIAADPTIVTPIGMAVDSRNRLFVLESHTHERPADYDGPPADRVKVFTDADGDGAYDEPVIFADDVVGGLNIAFSPDGTLYVVCAREVFRLPDRDGDLRCDGLESVLKLDTEERYAHNSLLSIAFDDEGWMYVGRGNTASRAYTAIGTDGTRTTGYGDGGSILRCRPDGSSLSEFATGFWNPFGIKFDPIGRLLCVDNDPDSRGPNRLMHVVEGGDFGYLSLYGGSGNHPFQGWEGERPGTLPMINGVGEAPCDLLHCRATALPDDFANDVLVTVWNEYT